MGRGDSKRASLYMFHRRVGTVDRKSDLDENISDRRRSASRAEGITPRGTGHWIHVVASGRWQVAGGRWQMAGGRLGVKEVFAGFSTQTSTSDSHGSFRPPAICFWR